MLPTQILLNNILYDLSEVPIPLDEVDTEELRKSRVPDMKFIRNFMLVIGTISSAFDFLTFYVMLSVLNANETLFQTGWFVESLSTQSLGQLKAPGFSSPRFSCMASRTRSSSNSLGIGFSSKQKAPYCVDSAEFQTDPISVIKIMGIEIFRLINSCCIIKPSISGCLKLIKTHPGRSPLYASRKAFPEEYSSTLKPAIANEIVTASRTASSSSMRNTVESMYTIFSWNYRYCPEIDVIARQLLLLSGNPEGGILFTATEYSPVHAAFASSTGLQSC
jgi:hypothetical protein